MPRICPACGVITWAERKGGVAEQRVARKTVQQSDPLFSLGVHIITWAKAHLTLLLYGVAGAVTLLAVAFGWSAWQQHHTQAAEGKLYEALKLLQARPPQRSQALTQLQELVKNYGNTTAAATAYWHMGHEHFEGAGYPAALEAYKQAQQRFQKIAPPLMLAFATLHVAYAQEASGTCDPEAVISFEAVLHSPASWLRGEAYAGIGRCYETTGAPQKAVTVYERALRDQDVSDNARQLIAERLALLQPVKKEQG